MSMVPPEMRDVDIDKRVVHVLIRNTMSKVKTRVFLITLLQVMFPIVDQFVLIYLLNALYH